MKYTIFCLFIFLIPTLHSLEGQGLIDTLDIKIVPISGKYEYMYNGSIIGNDDQLANFLKNSNKASVIKYAKKFKRRSTIAEIFFGIGGGFAVIWAINESANPDFRSSAKADRLWYGIVVGTTFTSSAVGALFYSSAKKQLTHGIEEFNKN